MKAEDVRKGLRLMRFMLSLKQQGFDTVFLKFKDGTERDIT